MSELGRDDYLRLVEYVNGTPIAPATYGAVDQYYYEGTVVAKERPRAGNGHHYTPALTRKFEANVKNWGSRLVKTMWKCPIRVSIMVYDGTDSASLIRDSIAGLVYKEKNDLDNIGKSICDALNGVMYVDDKQIVSLQLQRRYAKANGFLFAVGQAGLMKHEYETFLRYYKQSHQPA